MHAMRREDCHTFNLMAAGPAGSALAGQSRVLIHLADSRVIENTFWARRCHASQEAKKLLLQQAEKFQPFWLKLISSVKLEWPIWRLEPHQSQITAQPNDISQRR